MPVNSSSRPSPSCGEAAAGAICDPGGHFLLDVFWALFARVIV